MQMSSVPEGQDLAQWRVLPTSDTANRDQNFYNILHMDIIWIMQVLRFRVYIFLRSYFKRVECDENFSGAYVFLWCYTAATTLFYLNFYKALYISFRSFLMPNQKLRCITQIAAYVLHITEALLQNLWPNLYIMHLIFIRDEASVSIRFY